MENQLLIQGLLYGRRLELDQVINQADLHLPWQLLDLLILSLREVMIDVELTEGKSVDFLGQGSILEI